MPTVWLSLRRSLHCKSEPSDVHDPKARRQLSTILTKKPCRSGCSRSIANLKDVIHGSKRHMEKPPSCSPRSIGSSEFLNPITHEVILSNSRCELKITGFGGFQEGGGGGGGGVGTGGGSTFVGTLRPGTPGPGGHPTMHYFKSPSTPPRKSPFLLSDREGSGFGGSAIFGGGSGAIHSNNRASLDTDSNGASAVTCHKCGEQFSKWEAVETHHLSKHAGKKPLFSFSLSCFFGHFHSWVSAWFLIFFFPSHRFVFSILICTHCSVFPLFESFDLLSSDLQITYILLTTKCSIL